MSELTEAEARKYVYFFWLFLLLPWAPLALLAGMAFDAGNVFRAYLYIASVWTDPLSVLLVTVCKDRHPLMIFLPLLNLLVIFSDYFWKIS